MTLGEVADERAEASLHGCVCWGASNIACAHVQWPSGVASYTCKRSADLTTTVGDDGGHLRQHNERSSSTTEKVHRLGAKGSHDHTGSSPSRSLSVRKLYPTLKLGVHIPISILNMLLGRHGYGTMLRRLLRRFGETDRFVLAHRS